MREWVLITDDQLRRGLPPICVKSGKPATTTRKVRVSTMREEMTGPRSRAQAEEMAQLILRLLLGGLLGRLVLGRRRRGRAPLPPARREVELPVARAVVLGDALRALALVPLSFVLIMGVWMLLNPILPAVARSSGDDTVFAAIGLGLISFVAIVLLVMWRFGLRARRSTEGLTVLAHPNFAAALASSTGPWQVYGAPSSRPAHAAPSPPAWTSSPATPLAPALPPWREFDP